MYLHDNSKIKALFNCITLKTTDPTILVFFHNATIHVTSEQKKTIVSKLVSVISSLQIQGDRVFGQHPDGPPPLHGPVVPRGNLAHLNRTHNANTLRHETHREYISIYTGLYVIQTI